LRILDFDRQPVLPGCGTWFGTGIDVPKFCMTIDYSIHWGEANVTAQLRAIAATRAPCCTRRLLGKW